MNKPKLVLALPPPVLRLDVPQSRHWRDGSALIVTSKSITLVEASARYLVKPSSPILSLASSTSCADKS